MIAIITKSQTIPLNYPSFIQEYFLLLNKNSKKDTKIDKESEVESLMKITSVKANNALVLIFCMIKFVRLQSKHMEYNLVNAL